MWKAERMRRIRREHNTDMGAIRGDREGQNSRKEQNRRAENGREQTETDGDGRRMFENKFYITKRLKIKLSTATVLMLFESQHQVERRIICY